MEDKIFRATLANVGEYGIKFLPNINNSQKNRISFRTFFNNRTKNWSYRTISYALINGCIKILIYNNNAFMTKIKLLDDSDKLIYKMYDLNSPSFFKVTIFERGGFMDINITENKKEEYIFGKNDESKKYLLKLYDEIKHIKLEDVMYSEMYNLSSNIVKFDTSIKTMYDVYKKEYPEFENISKIIFRKNKLKKIKNLL